MHSIKTTIRFTSRTIPVEVDMIILKKLIKPQQSAMRIAYNRLRDNLTQKCVYRDLRNKFPHLSGWEINGAISMAMSTIKSQKALGYTEPAIFGSKKLWKKVSRRLPEAKTAWSLSRAMTYMVKGESANRYGNRNFRLQLISPGKALISIKVPKITNLSERFWVEIPVNYSRSYTSLLQSVIGKQALTFRLVRKGYDEYYFYLTIDETVPGQLLKTIDQPLARSTKSIIGIDINLDNLSIAFIDSNGQFKGSEIISFHNLGELPRQKTKWKIGNITKALCNAYSQDSTGIVLEDLHFTKGNARNRRTVPFTYHKIAESISREALRRGFIVKLVHPAYTSWIGHLKYKKMYGLSTHQAASYVIARRGMGFQERIPTNIVNSFPTLIKILQVSKIKDERRKIYIERLKNWHNYSPESGHPWMLWATLKSIYHYLSDARAVLNKSI